MRPQVLFDYAIFLEIDLHLLAGTPLRPAGEKVVNP